MNQPNPTEVALLARLHSIQEDVAAYERKLRELRAQQVEINNAVQLGDQALRDAQVRESRTWEQLRAAVRAPHEAQHSR